MPSNEIMSLEGQLCGIPLAGPESFSQQQLDYLKRALGVDETVLWENASGANSATLSESRENFEKIVLICKDDNSRNSVLTIMSDATEAGNTFAINVTTSTDLSYRFISCVVTSATTLQTYGAQVSYNVSSKAVNWMSGPSSNASYAKVFKIVGIHRIAGGN